MFLALCLVAAIALGAPQSMNCPGERLRFEKVLGLRPSTGGYKLQNDEPATLQCLEKCRDNEDCRGFVLYYNVSECQWYDFAPEGAQEFESVVVDSNVAWFTKTCLDVPGHCKKSWTFERVPGFTLVGSETKTLPRNLTRLECEQNCLDEVEFDCKSAKFTRNPGDSRGTCRLSDTDRHHTPNAYRAAAYNEEYLENQCANVTKREFCAYEEYEGAILGHVDSRVANKTKEGCEEACEGTEAFACRGYSLVATGETNDCLIHSEDSKVHGPRLLRRVEGARFYEKARCINVSVTCTESLLIVRYDPEIDFSGKIYMSGHSNSLECYATGRNRQTVQLKIPIFDNNCGVMEARSGNNRTLYSGNMLIQYNPVIQTQGDRLIRVGCVFSNESKVVLGTGVTFNNTASSGIGTTVINSTAPQPVVEMRIVDYYTQAEVADTQIGQELQLIIEIKPANGTYDIWAGHLLAMTDDVDESILLLDDRGCPTNPNVFPALTKIYNGQTRRLLGNFQAFKFTTSPIVRFSVIVQYCPLQCPTVNCSNERRKRETIDGTIVPVDKRQYDAEGKSVVRLPLELVILVRNARPIPDRLVVGDSKILVAGYDYVSDEVCLNYSLFIGIAVVWTLLQVILVVVCVLIVRHYRNYYEYERNMAQSLEELNRNFGFGNRRVHWADDDYT